MAKSSSTLVSIYFLLMFSFQSNKTSLPIIHLIDVIKPGVIDYAIVNNSPVAEEECMSNAKYAITMARKIGAPVYALPEDITEVNDIFKSFY